MKRTSPSTPRPQTWTMSRSCIVPACLCALSAHGTRFESGSIEDRPVGVSGPGEARGGPWYSADHTNQPRILAPLLIPPLPAHTAAQRTHAQFPSQTSHAHALFLRGAPMESPPHANGSPMPQWASVPGSRHTIILPPAYIRALCVLVRLRGGLSNLAGVLAAHGDRGVR